MFQDSGDTAIGMLSEWVARLSYVDIPQPVIETSKLLILDTLGVTIAATGDHVGDAIIKWASDVAAPGPATVVGFPRRVSRVDAAFANGTLAHALDFDDHGFGGHATACVLPAVLACAQPEADGKQLLTAYVAGMEAFGRLARCMPILHEYCFHPTAVLGLVAAAVGASKVAGRSADEIADTITVSCAGGAGVTASFGTTVKPLHVGRTASGGVQALQLVSSGFSGNRELFETRYGYGEAYTRGNADWSKLKEELAGPFRLEVKHPSIKQWPCCGGNQRSIHNLSRIMQENGLSDSDVAKVEVHVNPRQLVSLRYSWPTNAYEAKFCLPFSVSVTLAKGAPTLAAFRDAYWKDEQVLSARQRVEIIPDGTGEKHEVTVKVFTIDGRQFSRSDFVVHGSAGDPMTREEVSAKYFDSCTYGKIPTDAVRTLHDAVLSLDSSTDTFWKAWEGVAVTG